MKSLRFLLALGFASTFASVVVRADDKPKADTEDCSKMGCCKKDGKDGKAACATEGKSCCCDTGDKAKEEKAEPKK